MGCPLTLVFAETNKTHFVSIKVADIRAVKVGPALRPWAGITFTYTALGKCQLMCDIDIFRGLTREPNPVAIPRISGVIIEWGRNPNAPAAPSQFIAESVRHILSCHLAANRGQTYVLESKCFFNIV